MTHLLCLRHCQSTDNAAAIHSSRPPGASLTAQGTAEARAVYESIRTEPITAVYTSTAHRAVQTGAILGEGFGVTVRRDPRLLEYDIGAFEGTAGDTVGRRSREILRRWVVGGELDTALPGGETGHVVADRFAASLRSIAERHHEQTVVVVTHVGTLTLGLISLCSNLSAADVWGRPLGHGVPVSIHHDASGWSCTGWPATP